MSCWCTLELQLEREQQKVQMALPVFPFQGEACPGVIARLMWKKPTVVPRNSISKRLGTTLCGLILRGEEE